MNMATTENSISTTAPANKPRLGFWRVCLMLFIFSTALAVGGYIYIEHRLEKMAANVANAPLPSTAPDISQYETTLAMLEQSLMALHTRIDTMQTSQDASQSAIAKATARADTALESLVRVQETVDTQTQTITQQKLALASLTEKQQADIFAPALLSFMQLHASLYDKQASRSLEHFISKLDALAITPEQLNIRAEIATHIAALKPLLEVPVVTRAQLQQQLLAQLDTLENQHAGTGENTHPKEAATPADAQSEKNASPSIFTEFLSRHVNVTSAEETAHQALYQTLRNHAAAGELMAATRLISRQPQAADSLIQWQKAALHQQAVRHHMAAVLANLAMLTHNKAP